MEKEEHIQDYLHGRLSASEQDAFEVAMSENPELKNAVEDMRDLQQGIKEAQRQELKARLQNLKDTSTSKENEKKVINLKPYYLLAAAACVICFVMIGNGFFSNNDLSTDQLYDDYFTSYPNTMQPITRGNDDLDPTIKAFVAYEAQDYAKASKQFEEILKTKNDPDLKFYHSMSLLNENKDEQALQLLNELKRDSTLYVPQTYWYAALIQLKNGDKTRSRELIDSLKSFNSGFKDQEAQELLIKLKE